MNAGKAAPPSLAPAHAVGASSAEASLRLALARNPRSVEAAVALSELLLQTGRADASLEVTGPIVESRGPVDHRVLVAHASGLKALGRMEDALAVYRRAALEHGRSAVAAHNLAAQLGDMSRFEEAETLARRALAKGSDAPQTWAVLARALQGCNRLEESQHAYVEVLRRAPFDPDAHRELAQLVWLRDADMDGALRIFDKALAIRADPRLIEIRAMARKACGDLTGAYAEMRRAARDHPHDFGIQVTAARLATEAGDPGQGVAYAEAAVKAAPDSFWTRLAVCEAYLGAGEARKAEAIAANLYAEAPHNQTVLAFLATAWRLVGDDRYHVLYNYETMVSASCLDVPDGWADLESYLFDLAGALGRAHLFRAHPFNQSLVHGTQVSNLTASHDPAIRAFFEAVAGPIKQRLSRLGAGSDPFRSRNTFDSAFQGVWSVRLQADHGRHVDHVHPKGWISSACYVDLPPAVSASTNREGWLQFGQPGVKTAPTLAADHHVQPQAGLLVLFPSYMWHGTLPFSGEGSRLTIAFDLIPA